MQLKDMRTPGARMTSQQGSAVMARNANPPSTAAPLGLASTSSTYSSFSSPSTADVAFDRKGER